MSTLTSRGCQKKDEVRLYPPLRFATVEVGVHRGAFPSLRNFRFLRRLRLRTVVSLTPKGPTTDLEEWCEAEEVQMIHHQTTKEKSEPFSLSLQTVASVLTVLIDPAQHPVYVHCLDGVEATGIIVMCLRKLQNWSLTSIFAEHIRYLHGGQIPEATERFVSVEFGKGGVGGTGAGGTASGSSGGGNGNASGGVSSVGGNSGANSGSGASGGNDSDDLAVVVGERVPEWLWNSLRSPVQSGVLPSTQQTGSDQTSSSRSVIRTALQTTVRVRYNPPLFEASSSQSQNKDSNDGSAPLSANEKIPVVTSLMMIGDGLKIGRSSNSRVSGNRGEDHSSLSGRSGGGSGGGSNSGGLAGGGASSREGSDDGANSDTSDLIDDNDTFTKDHSQQFIIDFSKPLADQERGGRTGITSETSRGAGRSNKMALSRSLRALDLEGLEKNLTDRRISAHWDLVNSPW